MFVGERLCMHLSSRASLCASVYGCVLARERICVGMCASAQTCPCMHVCLLYTCLCTMYVLVLSGKRVPMCAFTQACLCLYVCLVVNVPVYVRELSRKRGVCMCMWMRGRV